MILTYSAPDHAACLDIFQSNCPLYFMPDELEGLQLWLGGQDRQTLAYRNTSADHFFVLEEGGKVLGCGGYYIVKDEPIANLVWGMIHAQHHKKGYGTQLYQYGLQHIHQNYPTHQLIMDTSQHTYGFYEKMGVKVSAITKDSYGEGLDRYDMK